MDDGWWMMEESTESTESTESIHWWMMDDGRKYRKYTLMDDGWWKKVQKVYSDGWWMMEESKKKVQKVKIVYFVKDGWKYIKYRMRHFDETFWQEIYIRHFMRRFEETFLDILMAFEELWWPLMTFDMVTTLLGWDYDSFDCLLFLIELGWFLKNKTK